MSDEKDKKIAGSMNDWSKAWKDAGAQKLAEKFAESEEVKLAGLKALEQLGVPYLKGIVLPLPVFLADSDETFEELAKGKYHVSLVSDKWQARMRANDLTEAEVLGFIGEKVPSDRIGDFTVILKRYYDNIYGGNLVIGDDGQVLIELVEGKHINLVTGAKTPTIIAERDPFLRTMKYYDNHEGQKRELKDQAMRRTVWETLESIPKDRDSESGKKDYHPGYYEFILVKDTPDGALKPLFIDYRDSSVYQLPQGSNK